MSPALAPAPAPPAVPAQPEDSDLVERAVELALLRAAIAQTLPGEGRLVLLRGPAGIGKTTLLAECSRLAAESGFEVLTARCSQLESDFAHGAVRQLFERPVLAPGETYGESGPGALHSLYTRAAVLAQRRPLMLVMDDAHWSDPASLRFFNYLAPRLADLPLLVVVSERTDETSGDAILSQTLAAAASTQIRPAELSRAGSEQLVRRHMRASDAFAAACHDSSGGNPFLLCELLAAVAADGIPGDDDGAARVRLLAPEGVRRAVFLRLARLPAGAVELARAVAVLGDHAQLAEAATLAGISPERARDLADGLAVAGLLAPERPLRFVHPMILEAVLRDLPPGERAASHALAAQLLHARGAATERVAGQLLASGPAGSWAVPVLRRAARAAGERGCPEVAQRQLERALLEDHTHASRGALLTDLGEARRLAGDSPQAAIAELREACELTSERSVRIRATSSLARAILSTGDAQAASAALLQILDGTDDARSEGRVGLEAELLSIGLLNPSLMPYVRERLMRTSETKEGSVDGLLVLCNRAVLECHLGTATNAAALARRALAGGALLAAVGSDAPPVLDAVSVLIATDCVEEAGASCEAALADARRRGSSGAFAACCRLAALAALRAGEVSQGERHARLALELPGTPAIWRPGLSAQLALALIERGELREAEETLELAHVGPSTPVLAHNSCGFYAHGLLRVAQGRDEDALADLTEYGTRQATCMVRNPVVPWRVDAARACLRLGRAAQAQSLLGEHETLAAAWGAPATRASALRGRAAAVDGATRIDLLERAHELLARSPCRLEEAHVLADLGAALRRDGQRRQSQRRLAEASALARRCGARALATHTNDELSVLAARPRRRQFSGVDSLTASERRVAAMAGDGLSNPQIAEALFVTAKTVENHLGRVYIKLALNSRTQLAEALAEPRA